MLVSLYKCIRAVPLYHILAHNDETEIVYMGYCCCCFVYSYTPNVVMHMMCCRVLFVSRDARYTYMAVNVLVYVCERERHVYAVHF